MEDIKNIIPQMTLEEKASLCSGRNFWYLKGIDRLGVPSILVTDGPHGLRKQSEAADHVGLNESVPATCFPTASALAATWNRDLVYQVGVALGEECRQEKVSVILGPGMNIKRSPLCGRNFEYFSEDPYLTGEIAKSHINGVQSQGVGTSVKHFAANNTWQPGGELSPRWSKPGWPHTTTRPAAAASARRTLKPCWGILCPTTRGQKRGSTL